MEYIRIKGRNALRGDVCVQGSKNAVLPMMAATLLADGLTVLENCPAIRDVYDMAEILRELGCSVRWEKKALCVDTSGLHSSDVQSVRASGMRSSCLFLGSLLGRFQRASVVYPGGCVIGKRPVDMHRKGLEKLGVQFEEDEERILAKTDGLAGAEIHLPYPSVGATENLMMAAVTADGRTQIHGCAKEPEVVELSCFLRRMGASIEWAEPDTLIIEGVDSLYPVEYTVMPDRIVAGTYLLGAVACRGRVRITDVPWQQLKALEQELRRMGAVIAVSGKETILDATHAAYAPDYVRTMPYPGFPTDLQSQLAAVLSVAWNTNQEVSVIEETVFESRFAAAKELNKMHADVTVDGRCIRIRPVRSLYGTRVEAADLRGGAALVIAGVAAEGITEITGYEFIRRGYIDIAEDFRQLGADIEKITTKQ